LAVFTREEAYTLPLVLLLAWGISSRVRTNWRRAAWAAGGVACIAAAHYVLRSIFLPNAIPAQPSLGALVALEASWMPSGVRLEGFPDQLMGSLWQVYLACLFFVFARVASVPSFRLWLGICALGLVLFTPALGVPRAFGIAMPTIAFSAAVSIAVLEIYRRASSDALHRMWAPAALTLLLLGIAIGVAGGVRRSMYVAEALGENSAEKRVRDGLFLFDTYERPATIPAERRRAGLERLARFEINTRDDLMRLKQEFEVNRRRRILNGHARLTLIRGKYEFLSF
jgi:hypothetical protein